jgi:hypothetical protein
MPAAILSQINYTAVLTAGIIYFILGTLWYKPKKLGKIWLQLNYLKTDGKNNNSILMLLALISTLTASFILSYFIYLSGAKNIMSGAAVGILTAVGIMATTIGFSFISEEKQIKLVIADTGYHLMGFMVMGIIISVWR